MKNLMYSIRPLLMDFASTAVFIAVSAATHNPLLATLVAIGVGISQVAFQLVTRRPVALMQWAGLFLVVVFGSATLISHDPRFMMVKPTLIYAAVGTIMLKPGWIWRYVPPAGQQRLSHAHIVAWGYVWSGLMFLTAALNLGVALTMSLAAWSLFMAIFPVVSKIGLFAVQYAALRSSAMKAVRAELAAAALPPPAQTLSAAA